jgi:hypothetical protein
LDNEPQSVMDLLTSPVESPSDAVSEEGLQSAPDGIQDGQSDAGQDGLASQIDPAQAEPAGETPAETTGDGRTEAAASPAAEPDATRLSAEEIADLRAKAEKAERFEQAITEARRQQEEAKQIGQFREGLEMIASGDLDADDIPKVAERVIADISAYGAKQAEARLQPQIETAQRERDEVHAALTSVVASIRSVAPDVESRILAEHQRRLKDARSSDEIQRGFETEQRIKAEVSAREKDLQSKVEALTAQLAGKQLQGSNVYATESQAGAAETPEPTSILDLLTNEAYGRPVGAGRRAV